MKQQTSNAPLSWVPLCLAAGAVWAALGLLQGASATAYLAMTSGAALSLGLGWLTVVELSRQPKLQRAWLFAVAVSLVLLPLLGELLVTKTHHRPLGAVTFAVFGLAALLGFLLLFTQRFGQRVPLLLPLGCAAASLLWVCWRAVGTSLSAMLDPLIGVLLLTLVWRLERRLGHRVPPIVSRAGAAILALGVTVSAVGIIPPDTAGNPWILGLVGLLR